MYNISKLKTNWDLQEFLHSAILKWENKTTTQYKNLYFRVSKLQLCFEDGILSLFLLP